MKLVSAKCPNCGADIKIDGNKDKTTCEYCKKIILNERNITLLNNISVDGIQTNSELIVSANELMDMREYLKAKKIFLEFVEKNPNDYQGWLGLLICRTRNFTIKDNNILFKKDVENYYNHFNKIAPDDIKDKYYDLIKNYLQQENEVKVIKNEEEFSIKRVIIIVVIILLILLLVFGNF